jgi:hypothetical protein
MEQKIQRYHVVIRQVLDATGTFQQTIYVPFVPDEVKTKQICYVNAGAATNAFGLTCDGLSDQSNSSLGFFMDPTVSFTGITQTLGRSVNGIHTFRILNAAGDIAVTEDGGRLQVHLEFRKRV